jgi:hypothetical protein
MFNKWIKHNYGHIVKINNCNPKIGVVVDIVALTIIPWIPIDSKFNLNHPRGENFYF